MSAPRQIKGPGPGAWALSACVWLSSPAILLGVPAEAVVLFALACVVCVLCILAYDYWNAA